MRCLWGCASRRADLGLRSGSGSGCASRQRVWGAGSWRGDRRFAPTALRCSPPRKSPTPQTPCRAARLCVFMGHECPWPEHLCTCATAASRSRWPWPPSISRAAFERRNWHSASRPGRLRVCGGAPVGRRGAQCGWLRVRRHAHRGLTCRTCLSGVHRQGQGASCAALPAARAPQGSRRKAPTAPLKHRRTHAGVPARHEKNRPTHAGAPARYDPANKCLRLYRSACETP